MGIAEDHTHTGRVKYGAEYVDFTTQTGLEPNQPLCYLYKYYSCQLNALLTALTQTNFNGVKKNYRAINAIVLFKKNKKTFFFFLWLKT